MFPTDDVGQGAEAELSNDSTSRGSQLDSRVRSGRHLAHPGVVDNAKHQCQERHSEDVIGVREEADAGHDDGPDMVPAERGTVDFGESEPPPLIYVLDVQKVVVEIVVCIVAA